VFNLYDVLGVVIPGITLLGGLLLFLPEPPAPTTAWEYVLYGIVAFSFGHAVQVYASKAVGDPKTFERTMDAARDFDEDQNSGDSGEDEKSSNGGEEENGTDGRVECLCRRLNRVDGMWWFPTHVVYSLFGPLLWWCWSPDDDASDRLHTNRVWRTLRDTYKLDPGTDDYEGMKQMISSEIDDTDSPSRAYRFQAIRNFQRGMWVAVWIVFSLLVVYGVAELFSWCLLEPDSGFPLLFRRPYVLAGFSTPLVLGVCGATLWGFWRLNVFFQREFVRYLVIDYFVLIRNREDRIED
jgi:hypothetical protein